MTAGAPHGDTGPRRVRPREAPVVVRQARPADLDALADLFAQLNDLQRPMRAFEPRPSLVQEARDRYARMLVDPDARVVVAEAAQTIVGMGVGSVTTPSTSSDERALLIANVHVLPGHQGVGTGRAIVAELAAFARDRGLIRTLIRTFAANEQAMRFWQGLGFQPLAIDLVAPSEGLLSGRSHPAVDDA